MLPIEEELYKTVHWRSFRTIAKLLAKMEHVSYADYDLNHITCYTVMGFSLMGKNVVFNFPNKKTRACFVHDNQYDMFEIPKNTNVRVPHGDYYFIAHNRTFDYWVFGELKVGGNIVYYDPYGFYHVAVDGENVSITKVISGDDCSYGENDVSRTFDNLYVRRRAYGQKASDVYAKKRGVSNDMNTLKGGEKVKIYKK